MRFASPPFGGIAAAAVVKYNNLQKRRNEKPSYDEHNSTGKAGCGKSARPV